MHAIGALWYTLVRDSLLASVLQDASPVFPLVCSAAVRVHGSKLSALKLGKIASAVA